MPSVGMKRSSGVLRARVLRSGRRILMESHEMDKNMREADGENKWIEIRDDSEEEGGHVDDRWENANLVNIDNPVVNCLEECNTKNSVPKGVVEEKHVDKRWGIVYRRKRKRTESAVEDCTEVKGFGIKFYKRRSEKKHESTEVLEVSGDLRCQHSVRRSVALCMIVPKSSHDFGFWVASFFASVLSCMTWARIGIQPLSAFLLSEPVFGAFLSHGLFMFQDSSKINKPGFCIIWGSKALIPLFTIDFSAIPFSFIIMHASMSLRSACLSCLFIPDSLVVNKDDDKLKDDSEEPSFQVFSRSDHTETVSSTSLICPEIALSYGDMVASGNDNTESLDIQKSFLGSNKYALRSVQFRKSCSIKKRRTSLRHKRGRPPLNVRAQKASGALASEFLNVRHGGCHFSALAPTRSSLKNSSSANIKDQHSSLSMLERDLACCLANLLVIEADKGYREEGVTIALELSDSRQWVLVVTKSGEKRYNLTAEKTVRPPTCNRFTHATIWMVDNSWKLEFTSKQDWLNFKELYKKCFERNLQEPEYSDIPVPGVQEVSNSYNINYVPYKRPATYITVSHDELTRALVKKKNATYDMDSDDEKWLAKLNNDSDEFISPEKFELIIDALEKGYYCHTNVDANYDLCVHSDSREVIDAIHSYWIKKRKQSCSTLVRIFQLYQPRRVQVDPKPVVLRKKRTFFKRKTSNVGRGKLQTPLQAMAIEQQITVEQRDNEQKLRQAEVDAEKCEGLAILKRERAQTLMRNADLATYKAMMALKIAEAAAVHIAEYSNNLETSFTFLLS